MDEYYIYLRKSRADSELEALGQGETLARHEKALLELAKRMNLSVTKIYKEIVSGETIASRPEIQRLLQEIYSGNCKGVLVMEVERLARGDTKDQGTIAEAFKLSSTKIITPAKTYNPNDEFDEEYFEFGLFMSRREYKTINRRIQRGRIASAQEGKFIGSTAPYGYEKVKLPQGKGYTLKIVEDEAKIVRYIYEMYVNGLETESGRVRLGRYRIAKKLDEMGVRPKNLDKWAVSSVRDILTSPVYAGKIRWGHKKETKSLVDGKVQKKVEKRKDCILVDGLHEAIISYDRYEEAQRVLARGNYRVVSNKILKNPLAGIVTCELCGATMTRTRGNKGSNEYALSCPDRDCKNISTPIYLVEAAIIEFMRGWIADYQLNFNRGRKQQESATLSVLEESINTIEKEIATLKNQISKTYDLLEQGIYTNEVFLERNKALSESIAENEKALLGARQRHEEEMQQSQTIHEFIPNVKYLLSVYDTIENAQEKNDMLKKVIDRVDYKKDEAAKKNRVETTPFHITVYPKAPRM